MFVNPWHAGRVKDTAHGQDKPVISKAAVARHRLQILYLSSVSGKQGLNITSFYIQATEISIN